MRSYYGAIALVSTLLSGGFILLNASFAAAQNTAGLEIKPAIIEDRAQPGSVYSFTLKVKNLSDTKQTFYLGAQDIKGLSDSGNPIFSDENTPTEYELSTWIKEPAEAVTFEGGEQKTLKYSLQVPANASPGSHFGSIYFDIRPPTQRTNSAGVGYRIGAVISLRIAGNVVEEAQLREFSTDKLIYGVPHITFKSKVDNLGNDLLRPHGVINITDMWGRDTAVVPVNDTGAPVFPGADRSYKTVWDGSSFAFGRYQAVLSLSYGDEAKKTISQITSFWVLPLKPILIVLGVFVGLILALYLFVKSYIRKKLRDMGVSPRGADPMYQAQRYAKPVSRATTIMFAVLIFSIAFLLFLLYLFA